MRNAGRNRWAMLLAVCALMLGLLAQTSSTAFAQNGVTSYEFATGQVLAWSGNWELDTENSFQEGDIELAVVGGELSFLGVMSAPASLDIDGIRDDFLTGFLGTGESSITIDRGSYGAVSYSLDTLSNDGTDLGAFTLLRSSADGGETFAWIFVSLIPTFASEFDKAQGVFTLDGQAPFTGIESAGLQTQLESAIASVGGQEAPATTEPDVETPEADPTEGTTTVVEKTPGSGGGLKGDNSGTATESDDSATTTSESPEAPAGDVGLISDRAYVSPAYGVEISWGPTVVLNPEQDANPSATATGIERMWLMTPAETPGFATVTLLPAEGTSIDNLVAVWSSADYLTDNAISPDAEIVLSESTESIGGVVRLDYLEDGTPVIFYSEFHLDESGTSLILLEFYTVGAIFEDAFAIVENELTVNGESVLKFFTSTEITEAAGI